MHRLLAVAVAAFASVGCGDRTALDGGGPTSRREDDPPAADAGATADAAGCWACDPERGPIQVPNSDNGPFSCEPSPCATIGYCVFLVDQWECCTSPTNNNGPGGVCD